jgi:hypothetical protein
MTNITIVLPPDATPIVHAGDTVTFDTEIARLSQKPTIPQTIPLAQSLNFKPSRIFKHLKKNIGDKIYKGDVLATKDAVFATKKFIADADGILTGVNHHSGEILIEHVSSEEQSTSVRAMLEGTVSAVEKDKILCKTSKQLSVDVSAALGDRLGGKVIITDTADAMQLTLPQVKDAIIVCSEVSDYVLSKFEALGVLSIVVPSSPTPTPAHVLVLRDPKEIQSIIDFVPHAVYANASEKSMIFYK